MTLDDPDDFLSPAWHAQHPDHSKKYPLCGTVSASGCPPWRVSLTLPTTCKKCQRIKAAKEFADKCMKPNV